MAIVVIVLSLLAWSRETLDAWLDVATPPFDLAAKESVYTEQTLARVLDDMRALYAAPTATIALTYTDFTPEGVKGRDGGFGLHTVKLFDDGTRRVLVNEHRRFIGGRLEPVSEIRVRTRVFTPRAGLASGDPGTEKDYVVARFRVAWVGDVPHLYREPRYREGRERHQREAPIGVHTCYGCHKAYNVFAEVLSVTGHPRNHETIVQPVYFTMPLSASRGWTLLLAHLDALGASEPEKERFRRALLDDAAATNALPELVAEIDRWRAAGAPPPALAGDEELLRLPWPGEPGVYAVGDQLFLDGLEAVLRRDFGRHTSWRDHTRVIPK